MHTLIRASNHKDVGEGREGCGEEEEEEEERVSVTKSPFYCHKRKRVFVRAHHGVNKASSWFAIVDIIVVAVASHTSKTWMVYNELRVSHTTEFMLAAPKNTNARKHALARTHARTQTHTHTHTHTHARTHTY